MGLLFAIYFLTGALLTHGRLEDIAMDSPNPNDIVSVVVTLFKWVFTWPAWAFQRGN
jgi:hypothetical protein